MEDVYNILIRLFQLACLDFEVSIAIIFEVGVIISTACINVCLKAYRLTGTNVLEKSVFH